MDIDKRWMGTSGEAEAMRVCGLLTEMGHRCGMREDHMIWYEASPVADAFVKGFVAGAGHVARNGPTFATHVLRAKWVRKHAAGG